MSLPAGASLALANVLGELKLASGFGNLNAKGSADTPVAAELRLDDLVCV